MTKPICWPALTLVASAFFVMPRFACRTVMVALPVALGRPVALAVAVLGSVPAVEYDVADTTWTDCEAAGARSPNAQLSWLPAMPHDGESGDSVQADPVAGSGSLRVTACAVLPPVFVTVTVKPTWLPASTVAVSAVFTT